MVFSDSFVSEVNSACDFKNQRTFTLPIFNGFLVVYFSLLLLIIFVLAVPRFDCLDF